MNKQAKTIRNAVDTLAEDAHTLLTVAADVVGEKVGEARKRPAAALEHGKEIYGRVREQVLEGARAAGAAMHEHPYRSIVIGIAVGALTGYLVSHRSSGDGK